MQEFSEQDIREVYEWVDTFNLSKVKRSIARDFSDAVLTLEILKHYYPDIVQINSIVAAHNKKDKTANWVFLRSFLISQSAQKNRVYFDRRRNP